MDSEYPKRRERRTFAKEEIPTKLGYPADYLPGASSLARQARFLAQVFALHTPVFVKPTLAEFEALDTGGKPTRSWYMLPRWRTVAPSYGDAVKRACDALLMRRKFQGRIPRTKNDQPLDPLFEYHCFEIVDDTERWIDGLYHDVTRGFFVVRAQFGIEHRGRSVRRAEEMFAYNEWHLDLFSILVMLLIEPDRLSGEESLCIDCGGTTHPDLVIPGSWDLKPCLGFSRDKDQVQLLLEKDSFADQKSGCVTGFQVHVAT